MDKDRGRPTKYIEGWTKLVVLGAFWQNENLTMPELAKILHVNQDTIYEWANRYPEFSEALEMGRANMRNALIGSALVEAMPHKYEEEFIGKEGVVLLKKHARANQGFGKLMLSTIGIKESSVVESKTTVDELDITKLSVEEQEILVAILKKAKK